MLRNPLDNAPTVTPGVGLAALTGRARAAATAVKVSEGRRIVKVGAPASAAQGVHGRNHQGRQAHRGDHQVTRHLSSLVMVLAVPALLAAQAPSQQPPATPPAGQAPAPVAPDASPRVDRILLTAGRSSVLTTDFDITRIAITNPAVADATVVQPREILLDGKSAGTVSLIVWGAGARRQYDVVVEPGSPRSSSSSRRCSPARTSRSDVERGGRHPVGPRLEHRRHAEGGRDCEGQRLEGQGDQPAAAPRGQRAASR